MKKNREVPMRRCIGCMESKPKNELVRAAYYDGRLSIDPTGKAKGRGVYLCPKDECVRKAVKKNAFRRSLGGEVKDEDIEMILTGLSNNGEEK